MVDVLPLESSKGCSLRDIDETLFNSSYSKEHGSGQVELLLAVRKTTDVARKQGTAHSMDLRTKQDI